MTKATKFKHLLDQPGSILLPVVHDALTAKLAENIGFQAVSVGGFAIAGINYGLPDVGLLGLSDMTGVIRHIVASTNLPVFADADGGYGNARNVARTVNEYEYLGVASLFLEDQKHPKRCGHMVGKELISPTDMVSNIKAAVAARKDPDLTICARTDAIAVEGFAEAISRAKAYRRAGADILFVEAPENEQQLAEIPRYFAGVPLLVNMLEGGKTPLLPQSKLEKMGYKLIAYPVTSLFSAVKATLSALEFLHKNGISRHDAEHQISFSDYKRLVQVDKYL